MAVRPVLVAFSKGDDHQSSMAAHFLRACDDPTCVHQATDLLALPGIIRGSLDVDAAFVDDDMRVAAVRAMVALAPGSPIARRRSPRRSSPPLVPSLVDRRLVPAVASSVASTAVASGAARARAPFDPNRIDEVLGCGLRVRNGTPTSHRPLNQRNYPAPESGPVRRCARFLDEAPDCMARRSEAPSLEAGRSQRRSSRDHVPARSRRSCLRRGVSPDGKHYGWSEFHRPDCGPPSRPCQPMRADRPRRKAMAIWQDLVDAHGFAGAYASVWRFLLDFPESPQTRTCAADLR